METGISSDILKHEIISYLGLSTVEKLGMTSKDTSRMTFKMRQRMKLQNEIDRIRRSLSIDDYLISEEDLDDDFTRTTYISVGGFPQPKLPYGVPDLDYDNNKIPENIESNDLWVIFIKLMSAYQFNQQNDEMIFEQIRPYVPELFKYNLFRGSDRLLSLLSQLYPIDEFISLLEKYHLSYDLFKTVYYWRGYELIDEYVDGDKFSLIILSSILNEELSPSDPETVDFEDHDIPPENPIVNKIFDKLSDYIKKCDHADLPKFPIYHAFTYHMTQKFVDAISEHENYYRPDLIMWYYHRDGIQTDPDFFHEEYLKAARIMPDIGERLYAFPGEIRERLINFFVDRDIIPRDIELKMSVYLHDKLAQMRFELEKTNLIREQIDIIDKYKNLLDKSETTYAYKYKFPGKQLGYDHIGIEAKKHLLNIMSQNTASIDRIYF